MGDEATNKAMAIAYKYVCFQVFCIPTEDMSDPDAENLEGEIANPYQETKKTKGQKKINQGKENRRNDGRGIQNCDGDFQENARS